MRDIFQHDPGVEQRFADAVSLGEIFGFLGGDARVDLRADRGIVQTIFTRTALQELLRVALQQTEHTGQ